MVVGATVASAVAVPLAVVLGGWSYSLAVWAVPAVLAAAIWVPVGARVPRPAGVPRAPVRGGPGSRGSPPATRPARR